MMVEVYLEESGKRLISESGNFSFDFVGDDDEAQQERWVIKCDSLWAFQTSKHWDVAQILEMPGEDVEEVKIALINEKISVEMVLVDNRTRKKAVLYYTRGQNFEYDVEELNCVEDPVERKLVLINKDVSFRLRSRLYLESVEGMVKAQHQLRVRILTGTTNADFFYMTKRSLEWT